MKMEDTICWECKWAAGKDKKCPRATKFEPVPGWKATPTKVTGDKYSRNKSIDSFIVHECPQFELEDVSKWRFVEDDIDYIKRYQKEDIINYIRQYRAEGKNIKKIAKLLFMSESSVCRFCRKIKENER